MPWFTNKNLVPGTEQSFRLVSDVVQEKFSVWDSQNKKFIQEGEILLGRKVDKYIKLTDEEKKTYNRNMQFIREVIINGEQMTYPMNKTTNDALVQKILDLRTLGKDPLKFEFLVKKEGSGLQTKYFVSLGKEIGAVATEQQSTSPPVEEEMVYSETETKVINGLNKNKDVYNYNTEQMIAVFTQNGVTRERAEIIVSKEFK